MAIFTRDFREVGAESFTDFNPNEDVLNFRSVNEGRAPEEFQRGAAETFGGRAREFNDGRIVDAQGPGVSLAEVDGGTMISAGMGNSLFIANVTPDQLGVSNITLDGQAIAVSSDTDFQSILDVIAPTAGENTVGGDGDDKLAGSVGDDTLDGGAGDDVLNSGRGADTLDGGEGNDNLTGGMGDDVLFGGEGDDVLFGDQQDDILDGGAGDDVLRGGAGTDTLHGGEGDDVLDGGARSDTLTGGDGGDTFVQNFSQGGADTITDFNPDEDTIDFGGLAEANIAVEAVDGGTLISGGENTSVFVANVTPDQLGASNITVDGEALTDGSPLGSILSTFEGNNSTIEGEAEDEALAGGTNEDVLANDSDQTGEDTLEGGAGDDTLSGGTGNDTLVGGAGDDTLEVDASADVGASGEATASKLTEVFDNVRSFFTGRAGDDTIMSGIGNDELDGGAGDDTLMGLMGHDTLSGGEGDDILSGMRGKDNLYGGEGDDLLKGGAGRDRLDGGAGDDELRGGGGTDTLTGGAGNDTFVQDFSLSGSDDITDFNPAEDTIDFRGLQGSFEISVTAENGGTLIDGGTGNTLFVANITPDQLSADNVTIDGNAITLGPGDTLESVLGDAAADQQGDDLNIRGFGGDQNFTGGAGNDRLDGGAGDDALAGGEGDDTLIGRAGEDNLDGGAGADTLGGGRGEDVLTGGAGDDRLDGGAGDDALAGGEGRDTFIQNFSEEGADTISDFNPAQDTIDLTGFGGVQNAGKIAISEVEGGSTLIEIGSGTLLVEGVTPDQLGANNVTVEGQGLGVGSGEGDIESLLSDFASSSDLAATDGADSLVGGRGDDVIDGGAGDDILDGGGGRSSEDVLDGGAGDDTLFGRGGVDTLEGGTGDDILFGNRGNDSLSGGAGDDILEGGRGNDTLEGGTGNDTFVQSFNSVAGQDEILDFNPAEDTIDLIDIQNVSEFSITAVDDGALIDGGAGVTVLVKGVTPEQLSADNFTIDGNTINLGPGDTLESVVGDAVADLRTDGVNFAASEGEQDFTGGDGADTLAGGDGADTLGGGAGDDTLKGQHGDDTLEGGAGDDTLSGGTGNDTLVGGAGDDTLGGGTGDDVYTGGAGSDTFIAELGKPGVDTISDFNPSQDTIDLQGFGGIENISRLSVSEADGGTLLEIGTGGSLYIEGVTPDQLGAQNLLVKGEAIDVGSGGSDLLSILNQSISNNETPEGGAGDDILEVDASADVGASGEATATVGSEASAGAGVSIDGDAILDGGAGEDVLSTDNEQVVADDIAEDLVLRGGGGDDTLEGGAGDDRLKGGRGDDTVEGGAGDDNLRGDKGDDTLDGGAGDDILKGGTGDDTLEGGAGDDTLEGGKGADTFIQDFSQPGEDTITDFNPNQDVIDFGGLNDFENISISEVDGNTLISAGEGNTLTINNVTPDQLSADNVIINGEAPSADNFNLQNSLSGAASEVAVGGLDALSAALGGDDVSTDGADIGTPTDAALGNALDNAARQGGAPNGGAADTSGGVAAGLDIVADDVQEDDVDEAQADEVAAG